MVGPMFECAYRRRLHPDNGTARRTQRPRKPIDIRHDATRIRNFEWKTLSDEIVLHVDDHKRGACSSNSIMAREPALTADYTVLNRGGNGVRVHYRFLRWRESWWQATASNDNRQMRPQVRLAFSVQSSEEDSPGAFGIMVSATLLARADKVIE